MPTARRRISGPRPTRLLEAAVAPRGPSQTEDIPGAAPGVGKIGYEMLTAAQARRRDGIDVVIGIVEDAWPAGDRGPCSEAGLWRSPAAASTIKAARSTRRWISTRILRRHPRLVLVDELAPTPIAPGSRHPKRYLRRCRGIVGRRGIDVYIDAQYIQHVESLNDVVA